LHDTVCAGHRDAGEQQQQLCDAVTALEAQVKAMSGSASAELGSAIAAVSRNVDALKVCCLCSLPVHV
jgi:hypothetical protein